MRNLYEDIACSYLVRCGFEILARNYFIRGGEIDIIARRGSDIYFIEVRHRSPSSLTTALGSITLGKMKRIVKTAVHFINHRISGGDWNYHFSVMDVGEQQVREVVWDAFSVEDAGCYYW